jgi:hypothetical protein
MPKITPVPLFFPIVIFTQTVLVGLQFPSSLQPLAVILALVAGGFGIVNVVSGYRQQGGQWSVLGIGIVTLPLALSLLVWLVSLL